MKTSTKIFIGSAALAVAICIANFIVTQVKYKKYQPVARRIAEQLDVTPIRVLDISIAPMGESENRSLRDKGLYSRNGIHRWLNVPTAALEDTHVSGDTLSIANYPDYRYSRLMFSSPDLETVIIHEAGKPDEVFDYKPEPEPEAEAEAGVPAETGAGGE